jgi:hypothetical protein
MGLLFDDKVMFVTYQGGVGLIDGGLGTNSFSAGFVTGPIPPVLVLNI